MKRVMLICLVFLAIFLSACNGSEPEEIQAVEEVNLSENVTPEPEPPKPGEAEAELFMQYYRSLVTRDQNKINKRAGFDPTTGVDNKQQEFMELYNSLSSEGQEILADYLNFDSDPYDPSQVNLDELLNFFEFEMWDYWGLGNG